MFFYKHLQPEIKDISNCKPSKATNQLSKKIAICKKRECFQKFLLNLYKIIISSFND